MSDSLPSRILFAVRFPLGLIASQRFRFEHYLRVLDERGVRYDCVPFWDEKTTAILYKRGHFAQKVAGTFKGLARRMAMLTRLSRYDVVYVHREMAPIGPPVFEWLVARAFKIPVIYDFDDAIWISAVSEANPGAGWFKSLKKVSQICGWAVRVSVGNEFLAQYARRYQDDVVIIPTVVDTANYHNRTHEKRAGVPVIGWTGSHSTVEYLRSIAPVLDSLSRRWEFELVVIADREPEFELRNIRFVRWNKQTEIDDLLRFDIGIMPVPNTDFARGKCGFKIIQYMSLGIPSVASPVGVNSRMLENGVDGYLCETESDWENALETLLADPDLRQRLGAAAREKAESRYSVAATSSDFLASIEFK